MVYYEYHQVLSANTSKANAEKITLAFSSGIIRRMEIFHPPGCQQLARSQIYEDENQRWPQNPDEYIAGDSGPVIIELEYPIKNPPHEYTWRCWNVDETYDHTLTLRAVVTPEEDFIKSLESVAKNLEEFIRIYKHHWRIE